MEREIYIERFTRQELSLLLVKEDQILFQSRRSGLAPLIEAIEEQDKERLVGSYVFDKIVGKAAALLISYFKGTWVYTITLSQAAKAVLEGFNVTYEAENIVEKISAAGTTSQCPFEKAVANIEEPKTAYKLLRQKIHSQNS